MLVLEHKRLSAAFIVLSAIYIAQNLATPDPQTLHKYHVTRGQVEMLALTVALPYIAIWFVALVGYLGLRKYSQTISKSKDGQAFRPISWGILLLTLWLPLSAVLGGWFSALYRAHPGQTAHLTQLNNYLNMLLLLAAFIFIDQGAKRLVSLTSRVKRAPNQKLILLYIAFAVCYVWLVLSDPSRRQSHGTTVATYYQPDWLVITTIVIPRLITWFLGAQAVQNIYFYARKVKGPIYKAALRDLAYGIAGVSILIISLRCLQSLTNQLERLSLGGLLILVYALVIIIGIAYFYLAKGSRKLLRIEES